MKVARRSSHVSAFGIDPGSTGGIVWIKYGFALFCDLQPLAKITRAELVEWISERAEGADRSLALVEKVSASPQMGVVSAFTFGRNYERVIMACVAAGVPCERILPKAWQKAVGVTFKPKTSHTEHKQITRARAQEMYPISQRITNATADALLIAHVALQTMSQGG